MYRALGDIGGEAEALFWVGCLHQVVRRGNTTAVPVLEQSLAPLDEASTLAKASQAHRILQQVNEARAELSDQHTHRPA